MDEVGLQVQLFGQVTAWHAGEEIPLGPPAQRALFALVALAGGRPVARAPH
jgi:DNA-binding SARP family transcriptional activator